MNQFKNIAIGLITLSALLTGFDSSRAESAPQTRPLLIISDIDDTIKVSHILSHFYTSAQRALDTTTPFFGMARLYQEIKISNPEKTKFVYLSNAPDDIGGFQPMRNRHELFLQSNHFPAGDLIMRDLNLSEDAFLIAMEEGNTSAIIDPDHKIKNIRKLVQELQPSLVIMIGDNGERDVPTYQLAAEELNAQKIPTLTYIHTVYSSQSTLLSQPGRKLAPGQIPFATSMEIAFDLASRNLLRKESLQTMNSHVAAGIIEQEKGWLPLVAYGSIAFPVFMNCEEFQWSSQWDHLESAKTYKNFLESVCH